MRLLNSRTLQLEEFIGDANVPPYAILSHTWGEEEVTLRDMISTAGSLKEKKGFKKIQNCCSQALADGLHWAWVDTCCIDKTSSAELSEAINSMFRWYSRSKVCYAYLTDVPYDGFDDSLPKSRWFTRGWTLQELLAPSSVVYYSAEWTRIGDNEDLISVLRNVTRIDEGILSRTKGLDWISVAEKMSWAATRETTRVEDMAYCLLGIFDVNMPLLYGEGERAFQRLQEEILRNSQDQSLFAW
ncbi:HET-domain-containing protein, partial [Cenococcum geophilum 1.58]|uniref:HET-domain-containing protein n=1 Tax=Cenococcum geophilum 1.58 TaxID=794803 RepID=UPI00358FC073